MNKSFFSTSPSHFGTIRDAMEISRLGRASVMRIADSSNSIIRIGRSVRIDLQKFENALQNWKEERK